MRKAKVKKLQLDRIHRGRDSSVYIDDMGRKWIMRVVNREYRGRKNPPVMYLLRQDDPIENPDKKPVYISGLFRTQEKDILSGDEMDRLGFRRTFRLSIEDDGNRVIIEYA